MIFQRTGVYHDVGSSNNQISGARTSCNLFWTVSLRKLDHVKGDFVGLLHAGCHSVRDSRPELCPLHFWNVPVDVNSNTCSLFAALAFQSGYVVTDWRIKQL